MNLQELWSEIQDLHSDFFLAQGSQKLEKLKNQKFDQGFSSMIQLNFDFFLIFLAAKIKSWIKVFLRWFDFFDWIEASSKIEKCHQKVEFPHGTVETKNQRKNQKNIAKNWNGIEKNIKNY